MQVISELTLNCCSLKLKEDPSFKYLQSPHLGSLHFVTVNFVSFLFENFALINNFFKFRGWRFLFKNVFFENNVFSLSSLERIALLWRISGYIVTASGYFPVILWIYHFLSSFGPQPRNIPCYNISVTM